SVLDDQPERDGNDAEINPAHPHRRVGEQYAENRRNRNPGDAPRDQTKAKAGGQDRAAIGAKSKQSCLTQRNQTGKPDKHVQSERKDRVDEEQHEKPQLILVVRGQWNRYEQGGKQDESENRAACGHTLKISRLPNKPCGKTRSTRMVRPKPTISRAAVEM